MAEEPDVRARYAEAASRPRTAHLDDAGWEELACRDLSPAARVEALQHVTACADCARIYRALEMMAAEARRFDPGAASPPPGDGEASALRSAPAGKPIPVEPRGPLSAAPSSFSWQPCRDARGYRVLLLDGEGETLWTSPEVGETFTAWPAALPPKPGRYFWRVDAIPTWDGAAALGSELVAFDVPGR